MLWEKLKGATMYRIAGRVKPLPLTLNVWAAIASDRSMLSASSAEAHRQNRTADGLPARFTRWHRVYTGKVSVGWTRIFSPRRCSRGAPLWTFDKPLRRAAATLNVLV